MQQTPRTHQEAPLPPEGTKSFVTAWLLSMFLGFLGADRLYRGQLKIGLAKLLTLGGLGVWAWIDWLILSWSSRPLDNQGLLLGGFAKHRGWISVICAILFCIEASLLFALLLLINLLIDFSNVSPFF